MNIKRDLTFTCVLVVLLGFMGCAKERPVLYPNPKLEGAGEAEAQRDIDDCMRRADAYVSSGGNGGRIGERAATGAASSAAGGAAAGAVRGSVAAGAERGAAGGAARGLVRGLLHETFRAKKPSKAHRAFVRRCLHERGYDLIGWE